MDHLCYLRLVLVMLSRLFMAALWSPAGKMLTVCLLRCLFVFLSLSHVVSWVRCDTRFINSASSNYESLCITK